MQLGSQDIDQLLAMPIRPTDTDLQGEQGHPVRQSDVPPGSSIPADTARRSEVPAQETQNLESIAVPAADTVNVGAEPGCETPSVEEHGLSAVPDSSAAPVYRRGTVVHKARRTSQIQSQTASALMPPPATSSTLSKSKKKKKKQTEASSSVPESSPTSGSGERHSDAEPQSSQKSKKKRKRTRSGGPSANSESASESEPDIPASPILSAQHRQKKGVSITGTGSGVEITEGEVVSSNVSPNKRRITPPERESSGGSTGVIHKKKKKEKQLPVDEQGASGATTSSGSAGVLQKKKKKDKQLTEASAATSSGGSTGTGNGKKKKKTTKSSDASAGEGATKKSKKADQVSFSQEHATVSVAGEKNLIKQIINNDWPAVRKKDYGAVGVVVEAARLIRKGEVVTIYGGEIVTENQYDNMLAKWSRDGTYDEDHFRRVREYAQAYKHQDNEVVILAHDPEKTQGLGHLINHTPHSRKACRNVDEKVKLLEIRGVQTSYITFMANRKIQPGEQVLRSYTSGYRPVRDYEGIENYKCLNPTCPDTNQSEASGGED